MLQQSTLEWVQYRSSLLRALCAKGLSVVSASFGPGSNKSSQACTRLLARFMVLNATPAIPLFTWQLC